MGFGVPQRTQSYIMNQPKRWVYMIINQLVYTWLLISCIGNLKIDRIIIKYMKLLKFHLNIIMYPLLNNNYKSKMSNNT